MDSRFERIWRCWCCYFKSSKHLDFENKRYSIESKDQLSFLVKNGQKKKKDRIIKTPDLESKNRNRMNNKTKEDFLDLKNKWKKKNKFFKFKFSIIYFIFNSFFIYY